MRIITAVETILPYPHFVVLLILLVLVGFVRKVLDIILKVQDIGLKELDISLKELDIKLKELEIEQTQEERPDKKLTHRTINHKTKRPPHP
jgi:hypothetical protein